ncbi:hypothetical protein Tco_0614367, partial [Tanacetum coccineum]
PETGSLRGIPSRELWRKASFHESSNDDDNEKLNGECDAPLSLLA